MFCTKCGGSLADEAKFCPSCGQSTQGITQNPAVAPRTSQTTEVAQQQIPGQGTSPTNSAQAAPAQQTQVAQNYGQIHTTPTPQQGVVRCSNCGSTRVSIQQGKNTEEINRLKAKRKKLFIAAVVLFVAGIPLTIATGILQLGKSCWLFAICCLCFGINANSKAKKLEQEGSALLSGFCGDCGHAFPIEAR